ncbi:MAG: extracellular solute-binding protein [Anaerolineales bacterium]
MKPITRRKILRGAAVLCSGLASALVAACKGRIIEVERIVRVEKEVTKVVTEIVRETVVVEKTPQIVERTVENVVTPTSAPDPRTVIVADVTNYGWTEFATRMSPAFQEMFPHIAIRWRGRHGWGEYPQRIAALQASGQTGDLLEAPMGTLLAAWTQRGLIRPLDSLLETENFDTGDIFQGGLNACRHEGGLMGMPFLCHAGENVLLYNQALFAGADLPHPTVEWTLEDLERAGRQLTRDTNGDGRIDHFGYVSSPELPHAYPLLHLFDAHLLSEDGKSSAVTEDNTLSFLRWAHGQRHAGQIAPTPAQVERGPLEMFRTGRAAMLRGDLRTLIALNRMGEEAPPTGSTLLPTHPDTGREGTLAQGMVYAITQTSEIPQHVLRWIRFMCSREMGVQMFLGGYAEPGCRAASWKDPRVLERFPICSQIAEAAEGAEAQRLPWNLRTTECLAAWNRDVRAILSDQIDIEDGAERMAKEIEEILDRAPEDGLQMEDWQMPTRG